MSGSLFISRFRLQHFRCVNDCELKLTPLHALVGPNDSGKSTLLAALAAAQWSVTDSVHIFNVASPAPPTRRFELFWSDGYAFKVAIQPNYGPQNEWELRGSRVFVGTTTPAASYVSERQGDARLVRLEPDEMRKPSHLIPTAQGIGLQERGAGLAAVYDALLARKRKAFDAIEKDLVRLFPQVESLVLSSVSTSQKELAVQLRGQEAPIGAANLSEGMLYFLAFRALPHLDRTPLVLVEEPENGLHPARIAEVVGVLRELSKSVQVVMATHSPLVINELAGNEISVVTRDQDGTHAALLSETPRYEERASVYKNGEIWLTYADGKQEAALLGDQPTP